MNKETTIQKTSSDNRSILSILQSDSFKQQVSLALPRHMTPERMIRIALTELRKTPQLLKCDSTSLLGAIVQCSQLGLEPGNNLGHAYLIPYGRECTLIIGYKGLIDLSRRSGQIVSISAREVRANDKFKIKYGLNEVLEHEPNFDDRGELKGFYAIAQLKDGGHQFEYMPIIEINKIRDTSKSSKSSMSPWGNYYEEMAKKTVIRRLFKYLPVSVEIQQAVALDEQADAGIQNNSFNLDSFEEADALRVVTEEENKETL